MGFEVMHMGKWTPIPLLKQPRTPNYPLHVKLITQYPSETTYPDTTQTFLTSSWSRPQMYLEVHDTEYGEAEQFHVSRGIISQMVTQLDAVGTPKTEQCHLEFYGHTDQLVLEFQAYVVEMASQYDDHSEQWFHGTQCLCANKETLF